jgi:poly(A) polymerase
MRHPPRPEADEPGTAEVTSLRSVGNGEPVPETYTDQIAPERVDSDAVKVLRRLTRKGHKAYLVGGGVRDLLLNRSPKDFDIATSARPNQVKDTFGNCRIIGRRFRLAHILFSEGKVIEVATFRRDPTVPGAGVELFDEREDGSIVPAAKERNDDADLLIRQDNTFGHPHEDAIRRDFTINGLFYDIDRREVIDYVGGVSDLRQGVVRTIGEPDVRFREDPVRILRAIKFSARLDFGIAPEVYDAMVDQRDQLSRAAPPRLLEEILRLLRGGAAQRSIYLAWDVGVLGVVLPELLAHLEDEAADADLLWGRLTAIDELFDAERPPSDAVLLSALLYGPLEEAVSGVRDPMGAFNEFFEDVTHRLAVPRRTRDRMRLIFAAQRRLDRGNPAQFRRREFFADAAMLFELRCLAEGRDLPDWLDEVQDVRPPPSEAPPRRRRRRAPRR